MQDEPDRSKMTLFIDLTPSFDALRKVYSILMVAAAGS
jgi:hypothetical protein